MSDIGAERLLTENDRAWSAKKTVGLQAGPRGMHTRTACSCTRTERERAAAHSPVLSPLHLCVTARGTGPSPSRPRRKTCVSACVRAQSRRAALAAAAAAAADPPRRLVAAGGGGDAHAVGKGFIVCLEKTKPRTVAAFFWATVAGFLDCVGRRRRRVGPGHRLQRPLVKTGSIGFLGNVG